MNPSFVFHETNLDYTGTTDNLFNVVQEMRAVQSLYLILNATTKELIQSLDECFKGENYNLKKLEIVLREKVEMVNCELLDMNVLSNRLYFSNLGKDKLQSLAYKALEKERNV